MHVTGRLAESEGPVAFAPFEELEKCEFIKANAPVEAWASTDDGVGVLVKVDALREQAREVLVSAAQARTPPPTPVASHGPLPQLSCTAPLCARLNRCF